METKMVTSLVGRASRSVAGYGLIILALGAMPLLIVAGVVSALSGKEFGMGMVAWASLSGQLIALAVLLCRHRELMVTLRESAADLAGESVTALCSRRAMPWLVLACVVAMCLSDGIGTLVSTVVTDFQDSVGSSAASTVDLLMEQTSLAPIPSLLSICLLGPIVEELLFRGVALRAMLPVGRVFTIVMSAFMFALMHHDLAQGASAFVSGLALGFVAVECSLLWAMAFHIVNNTLSMLAMLLAQSTLSQAIAMMVSAAIAIVGAVLLGIRLRRSILRYGNVYVTSPGAYAAAWRSGWLIAITIVFLGMALLSLWD